MNEKFSGYYFYINMNIQGNFQICISVPLKCTEGTSNNEQKQPPRPASLVKKRYWHRRFPVNFAKFLRKPFHTEHLRWLLLNEVWNFLMLHRRQKSFIYNFFLFLIHSAFIQMNVNILIHLNLLDYCTAFAVSVEFH